MKTFRMERDQLAPHFEKFRLYGAWSDLFHINVNHFTSADASDADYHDHPFHFRSLVLYGGYTEEVLMPGGLVHQVERHRGDCFRNPAFHKHRIVRLHTDECWTLFLPEEKTQDVSFYRVREGQVWRRAMGSEKWEPFGGKAVAA